MYLKTACRFLCLMAIAVFLGCPEPYPPSPPTEATEAPATQNQLIPSDHASREALLCYYREMADGDLESMLSLVVPFERVDEFLSGLLELAEARRKFNLAGKQAFPEAPMFDVPPVAEEHLELAKTVEILKISENLVRFQIDDRNPPMELTAEDGKWRLNLVASAEFLDSIPFQIIMLKRTADLLEGLTSDIQNGTLDSAEAVSREFGARREQLGF